MGLAAWWRESRERAKEQRAETRRRVERNVMVERQNQIRRHIWGQVLGLGRPLTRSEATSVPMTQGQCEKYNEFLRKAASAGDVNAKWMIENGGLEYSEF